MKNKPAFLLLPALIACIFFYSCKKTGQTSIHALFTGGRWQLASVTAIYYTGNTQDSTKVLTDSCTTTQYFTFQSDNTCTYLKFDCIPQSPSGSWSLSPNQLFLYAQVVCKDTSAAHSSTPFANAQIINLGQFSMVLHTGDVQPNYSLTKKRRILEYGFIRQKSQ